MDPPFDIRLQLVLVLSIGLALMAHGGRVRFGKIVFDVTGMFGKHRRKRLMPATDEPMTRAQTAALKELVLALKAGIEWVPSGDLQATLGYSPCDPAYYKFLSRLEDKGWVEVRKVTRR